MNDASWPGMTTNQASTLVQPLQAAFPPMTLSSETIATYTAFLADLPHGGRGFR